MEKILDAVFKKWFKSKSYGILGDQVKKEAVSNNMFNLGGLSFNYGYSYPSAFHRLLSSIMRPINYRTQMTLIFLIFTDLFPSMDFIDQSPGFIHFGATLYELRSTLYLY